MKKQISLTILGMSLAARAGVYTGGFADGGYVPDGSTAGWSDTRNVTDVSGSLTGVSVTFTISGGYNGDLYAYLSHNGQKMMLLNQVGTSSGNDLIATFGYADAGFNNVTLADSGSGSIHNYGGAGVPSNATYRPDSGVTFASTFGGGSAGGSWTLFVADLSSGGGQSQVTSWSLGLEVSAVPEPANAALLVFGGVAGAVWGWKNRRKILKR